MSLPSYDEFRQALTDPAVRSRIGLVITDSDAQSLAGNDEWAKNYFDSWIAMAAPAPTAVLPTAPPAPAAPAPSAPSPFSSAPTEQFTSAPSAPFSAPAAPYSAPAAPGQPVGAPQGGQPGGYAPAGAAPQQGYASAPQQGQPFGGQPFGGSQGGQNMPQGQMPKKGLPGWALGVIIGGAALVLLAGAGVAFFVINGADDEKNTASSSQSGGDASASPDDIATPEPTASETPGAFDPDDLPNYMDEDYEPTYSEADKTSYLEIARPLFGIEEGGYLEVDYLDDIILLSGESICASIDAGYSKAELAKSMVSTEMDAAAVDDLIAASEDYICE